MPCYKRKLKRGNRWWYAGSYLGRHYHSKAIYLTKGECAKAERKKIKELDGKARNPGRMKLQTLMEKRLDHIQETKSKDYYSENRRYFKKALAEWGNLNIDEITKLMIIELLRKEALRLKKSGKGNWKANSMLRSLKALFNWGEKTFDIDIPKLTIDFYPIDTKIKYIPTDTEIELIKTKLTPMQGLLFNFVDQTACRIREATRLTWDDVKKDTVILKTRKAKNSNLTPRAIPKPDCLKDKTGEGKVFTHWKDTTYPRFLEEKQKDLEIKRWGWHCLRHRRASIWATSGMSIFEIMTRLGHTNMQTTMRYLQLLGYSLAKEKH